MKKPVKGSLLEYIENNKRFIFCYLIAQTYLNTAEEEAG